MENDKNKFFCCLLTSCDITDRIRGLQEDFEKKKILYPTSICMYICINVCTYYVYIHVCMYVCMYVNIKTEAFQYVLLVYL